MMSGRRATASAPRLTSALVALALTVMALASAPVAAALTSISPGDELDGVGARGTARCTLGYAFTDPATGVSYAITAGHCNAGHSSYVLDRTTGALGHFALTVASPEDPLADDYGLIDFGSNHSQRVMYGMPIGGISAPDPRNAVCHDGIRTGVVCGSFGGRLVGRQYLTTGMAQSIPGDSGGPVWQLSADNTATVIGIWLGEHFDGNGSRYGRFIGLTDILVDVADETHVL